MSPDDFKTIMGVIDSSIKESVAIAIEKHVNGKIRNLDTKIDEYIKQDVEWKKDDKAWKDNAQPTINLGSGAINWWNFTKWIFTSAGIVAAFFLAIQAIKESIKS